MTRTNRKGIGPRPVASGWILFVLLLVSLAYAAPSLAQARQDKGGVTVFWGVVPAAVVSQQHAIEEMHGHRPAGGGQVHHLVVAVFDSSSGRRIDNAVVRAQLSESGIVDGSPKYLTPMLINGQMSYGQLFSVAKAGPYHFRLWVIPPGREAEIEFSVTASSPHEQAR